MSQACAAFRLPLSQQQHMRLVDRGRVLEVGTFRTLLGVGVGAGSELMLTSETITSIGDHRSNYSFCNKPNVYRLHEHCWHADPAYLTALNSALDRHMDSMGICRSHRFWSESVT